MSGQTLRCAYCGEPLVVTAYGVLAWRAGDDFVCDEFCADGIESKHIDAPELQLQPPVKMRAC